MLKKFYRYLKHKQLISIISKRKIDILWYPRIETTEDFYREISRLSWYLHPILKNIKSITVIIDYKINNNLFIIPEYIDENVEILFNHLKDKIIFKHHISLKIKYDVVVKWKHIIKKDYTNTLVTIYSDVNFHQFDSTKLVKFSYIFLAKKDIEENNLRLNKVLKDLIISDYKSVLLVGSGPSLSALNSIENIESLSIICNSVVNNNELLKKIKPNIIVATDTVFHSGYSKYAEKFRKKACKVLDEYPTCYLFVPMRELLIYKNNIDKKYNKRIIGIEGRKMKNINLDILKIPIVKSTSNVLTFFMLPLATTLNKEIILVGFDGKGKNENNKFWSYEKKSQFHNEINYTKMAHPAFYKVDYEEYNMTHTKEVEEIIQKVLKNNYRIKSLAPSNLSCIDKLYE